MKRVFITATLMLLLTSLAAPQERLAGFVEVRDELKHEVLKDQSGVAVWLVPLDPDEARISPVSAHPTQYQMLQHDKRFEPHLLVVPVGSSVKFPNLDPWFHNVFSLYRGKRFDLGLYQAGSQKTVQFDRPGASYIFCNIHPEMSAVVLAVESHLIGISDRTGHVSISDVPPGRYRLHLWYEFAANPSQLESHEITVGASDTSFGRLEIAAKTNRDPKHKNKYGQDYDPESMTPEY